MSGVALEYRVRIRDASTLLNPNGTTDALVLTSTRGGTNPYIAGDPRGDGTEFDPITGATRTGNYTVIVTDPIVSPLTRVVTPALVDAQNRQQLLSRRVYVEFRENAGAWQTLVAGYMIRITLIDAITYELSIGDTRRVETTRTVFKTDDAVYFPVRGTLFGGPIIGGDIGPIKARGGWTFSVSTAASGIVGMGFVNGYDGVNGNVTTRWTDLAKPLRGIVGSRDQFCTFADSYYQLQTTSAGIDGSFPGISYRVYTTAGVYVGTFAALQTFAGDITGGYAGQPHIRMLWTGSLPTPGVRYLVNMVTDMATDACPLYVSKHPVDFVKALYDSTGFQTNAASFTTLKNLIGPDLRVTMRITDQQKMARFLETALQGPFGIGVRTNAAGEIEAFSARIKTTTLPTATIDTNSLQDAEQPIFDLDESTVTNLIIIEGKRLAIWDKTKVPTRDGEPVIQKPFDGIMQNDETYDVNNGDTTAFGQREIHYTIPGMVHTVDAFNSVLEPWTYALGREIFDRYGRGAQAGDARVLRGTGCDAVAIGDEVYVQPAHLPNAGKRFGDDPSVGARIMQVTRRTESPSGPELHLIDSGTAAQPATAPTITIAASGTNPYNTAAFTITNAATLNAAANLSVAVEWATGASSPTTNGVDFIRYEPAGIPTAAVDLAPVVAGSKVWVRARTEQVGRRPSAWTAWTSVTLTALTAPTGVTISSIKQTGATVSWTNTIATIPVQVFAAPSAAANPLDPQYLVTTVPLGSTRTTIRNLQGPTVSYVVSVRYVLPNNSTGPAGTATFSTNSTTDANIRPAGIAVINTSGIQDAGLLVGVALAIWPNDPVFDIEVERAPDSGGSPGTFALIATVPGTTRVYQDTSLPNAGLTYWYRIRSTLPGFAASSYTCSKSAIPSALPLNVDRPSAVDPVIAVSTDGTFTANTMILTITDPQCRVDFVEARTKIDPGAWSGYSTVTASPAGVYTVTVSVPSIRFGWIEMRVWGWNAQGIYGILFDQTMQFDSIPIVEPAVVITIGSNQSTSDTTAKANAVVNTPNNINSIKWLASTSAYPSQASVAVGGTSVAGPSPFFIADLGVTLAFNDTVFLTIITLDINGIITGLYYNAKATRSNLKATKTMLFPISSFVRLQYPLPTVDIVVQSSTTDYVQAMYQPGTGFLSPVAAFQASFILPNDGTVTAISGDIFMNKGSGTGQSTGNLYAAAAGTDIYSGGSLASVSAPDTNAWSTQTATLSQSTTSKRFALLHLLQVSNSVSTAADVRARSYSVTYIPNDPQATL